MPSGRTHDRITLWCLPFVAGLTLALTHSSNITLSLASGFLFSGLMFGPDLDIYSRQFIRWGRLRVIWIPYQKLFRHRSIFSHGPIIGTLIRSLYLSILLGCMGLLFLAIANLFWPSAKMLFVANIIKRSSQYRYELLGLFLGLEIGAMSHSVSDWSGSAYKRFKSRGWVSLIPKMPKPKKKRKSIQPRKKSSTKTPKI